MTRNSLVEEPGGGLRAPPKRWMTTMPPARPVAETSILTHVTPLTLKPAKITG